MMKEVLSRRFKKIEKETKKMANKLKRITDKTLINGISSVIIKNWTETESYSTRHDIFDELVVQEWFLNKDIDLQQLGLYHSSSTHHRTRTHTIGGREVQFYYFDEFGLSEKMRWQKIMIKIV